MTVAGFPLGGGRTAVGRAMLVAESPALDAAARLAERALEVEVDAVSSASTSTRSLDPQPESCGDRAPETSAANRDIRVELFMRALQSKSRTECAAGPGMPGFPGPPGLWIEPPPTLVTSPYTPAVPVDGL
jgi:hypothetical protein